MEVRSEEQDLLQLLYAAPVGLVHAAMDGRVEIINAASARWLMPLAPDGRLDNLFTILSRAVPNLRESVAASGSSTELVIDRLRLEIAGGRRRSKEPEWVSLTLSRLGPDRLMAVINDITQQVRDERALSEAAAHYKAVVSVLSEGIVVHDAAGVLVMCNAAAERSVGAPLPATWPRAADQPPAAAGWTLRRADGQPLRDADTPTGQVLAGGAAQEHVTLLSVSPGGDQRCFEVSAQPVRRPGSHELLAVVTSFTDITSRRALQAELEQHRQHLQELVAQRTRELEAANLALGDQQQLLRTVADAVPGLIGYWSADLRCLFSNQAYQAWFGQAPGAMLGRRMPELLGDALFEQNRPHVEAALAGQAQHFQRSMRLPDGRPGHMLASYIPDVVDGVVRGFNEVVSDVTELKQAELTLAELNEQLQRRALQADEATRAKSAFLANMSHEIRTPMNAIVGLAHLMRAEVQSSLQLQRLDKINEASRHLLQVINDILDLSKIEAGKMSLDETDIVLDELLSRVLGMVGDAARAKSIELVLDDGGVPQRLHGDAVRLAQCLINLLTNAVKFTERGWVCLRCSIPAGSGRRRLVRFEVQDTGPGIPAERQASLFQPFEQADNSSTRRFGGTGLGLALTRHFARLMGGDAGVDNPPGGGSCFWFTANLGVVPDAPERPIEPVLSGRHAWVLDDLPESAQALSRQLVRLGLVVQTRPVPGDRPPVESDTAATDLWLVDHDTPDADGQPEWQQWRRRWGQASPPALLLTDRVDAEVQQAAQAAGFAAVLHKPVTRTALREGLLRCLLPRQAEPVASLTPPGEQEDLLRRTHAGQSVLVVEDNLVNREVAVELLRRVGLLVETAEHGQRALEKLRQRSFDLVLMDVQMPVMDGLTATRRLRWQGLRTPILAMTANAFGDDRAACLAAGMDDHVAKPVDPSALHAALLRWLPALPSWPSSTTSAGVPVVAAPAGAQLPTATHLMDRLQGVAGLDAPLALQRMAGRQATLERALQCFCEVYAEPAPVAMLGQPEASVESLKACAHSLRGACAAIGATALQQALWQFEQGLPAAANAAARAQSGQALKEQLLALVAQLQAALRA